MQLIAHGPMAISIRKYYGNLVQTLAIGLSKEKNWRKGTKVCLANGSNTGVVWLVRISALFWESVQSSKLQGSPPKQFKSKS
jgi:carotenoid cleavage dioxygenase-like enzyme